MAGLIGDTQDVFFSLPEFGFNPILSACLAQLPMPSLPHSLLIILLPVECKDWPPGQEILCVISMVTISSKRVD